MQKTLHLLPKRVRSRWTQIYLGLFCTGLIFFADIVLIPFFSLFIKQLDNWIYDEIVQLNLRPHQTNPQVVIIDIDDKSVEQEGRWPWPRNKMAELVNKLKQYGVVTMGTDIVMSEPEVNYAIGLKVELQQLAPKLSLEKTKLLGELSEVSDLVDNDQIFANSLRDHNVVLGYLFHNDRLIKKGLLPLPLTNPDNKTLLRDDLPLYQFSGYNGCLPLFFKASTRAGSVTNLPDSDGTVRRSILIESFNNELYASLALAMVMNYLLVDHVRLQVNNHRLEGIQVGSVFIPTNRNGQIFIPFWGDPGTLNYYSASDILQGKINPNELQGAIAVIGSTMILLADLHESPVAPAFPGVEMTGNMVQGIISQQLIAPFDWQTTQARISLILIGFLFTLFFAFVNVLSMLLVTIMSILAILALSVFLFVSKSIYFPVGLLLTLVVLLFIVNYAYLFVKERQLKRKIHQLFGQYVPEDYVKQLVEFPDQSSMEGQERNMTVLFSDIRNFTSISENLDASHVKRLLNAFFTPITELIFSFKGTIDKYVGDMIIAFWGAPINDENHEKHAIMCALAIVKHLPDINSKMLEQDLHAVNLGVGLSSGLMNVGDMGSEFRRAYTVIGDTVNLASRLQDLTKFYQVPILVSDKTRNEQNQFVWRTIDKITVKGRKSGLTIYQPLGMVDDIPKEVLIGLEEYHDALNCYFARDWISAETKFIKLQRKYPGLHLYEMYLERVKAFLKQAPPEDWDGIYMHEHK